MLKQRKVMVVVVSNYDIDGAYCRVSEADSVGTDPLKARFK